MRFYFRDEELKVLELLWEQTAQSSRMSVIMGKRRVGKTSLALRFAENKPHVYLFVSKKAEPLLCQSFAAEITRQLGISIHGKVESFVDILKILFEYAEKNQVTVIIDEFQEFIAVNPSLYSELQSLWDLNKEKCRMQLIIIGSVYATMRKIFENSHEPLFGRADRIINLLPFSVHNMRRLLHDHNVSSLSGLFDFYVLTGGVPKHLDLLLTNDCKDRHGIIDFMLMENSPFLNEERNQLIEEFGKEYTIYFSILELMARGKTSTNEIASVIQKNISAYLSKLESYYHIIRKYKPIDAKPEAKLQKYIITDNFLRFWFNYFHRNRHAIEMRNFDYVKDVINKDYSNYSGRVLEYFFVDLLASTGEYNRIGAYWERGHKNEIDIIAINDMNKKMLLAEVKTNKDKNSLCRLQYRAAKLLRKYPNYETEFKLLSLEDAADLV
jgi:uncharacterized protein